MTARRAAKVVRRPSAQSGRSARERSEHRSRAPSRAPTLAATAETVLARLRALADPATREGMARYAISTERAFGIPVPVLRSLAKRIGPDQGLAHSLWESGYLEARMLACFVAEPERLSPAEMDRWCRDFDSWAIVDAACYQLFDRSPHAFGRVTAWARLPGEFQRRAAFSLIAGLAQHDRATPDGPFRRTFALIERHAADGRNFVKKGVSWALRGIGRRNETLHREALALARRLAASGHPAARWVGRDALRDLSRGRFRRPRAEGRPGATRSPRRRAAARS